MFPQQFNSPEWQSRIHAIVPSYGQKLNGNVALTQQVWDDTAATLQLTKPPVIQMPAAAPTATAKPAGDATRGLAAARYGAVKANSTVNKKGRPWSSLCDWHQFGFR